MKSSLQFKKMASPRSQYWCRVVPSPITTFGDRDADIVGVQAVADQPRSDKMRTKISLLSYQSWLFR